MTLAEFNALLRTISSTYLLGVAAGALDYAAVSLKGQGSYERTREFKKCSENALKAAEDFLKEFE